MKSQPLIKDSQDLSSEHKTTKDPKLTSNPKRTDDSKEIINEVRKATNEVKKTNNETKKPTQNDNQTAQKRKNLLQQINKLNKIKEQMRNKQRLKQSQILNQNPTTCLTFLCQNFNQKQTTQKNVVKIKSIPKQMKQIPINKQEQIKQLKQDSCKQNNETSKEQYAHTLNNLNQQINDVNQENAGKLNQANQQIQSDKIKNSLPQTQQNNQERFNQKIDSQRIPNNYQALKNQQPQNTNLEAQDNESGIISPASVQPTIQINKRGHHQVFNSVEYQNEVNQIQAKRKKIKTDTKQEMYIQISSGSDPQTQHQSCNQNHIYKNSTQIETQAQTEKKIILQKENQKFKEKIKEKQKLKQNQTEKYKQHKKYKQHETQKQKALQSHSNDFFIGSMLSSVKINYVIFSKDILVKYYKQQNIFKLMGKTLNQADCKVRLDSKYISVSKTINIQFLIQKISRKLCITEQLRNYRFWVFKGSIKNLEETIIENVRNREYLESRNFIELYTLYQWYTLAHLLSISSNLTIVIEKNSAANNAYLIKNLYSSKCQSCKSSCQYCLCLRFWNCRKKACQRVVQEHQQCCKFASQYRNNVMRSQFHQISKKGVIGIVNYKNSCFMNTALQCLAACEPLTEYFLQKHYVRNLNFGNQLGTFGQIATRYAQFIREIFSTTKQVLEPNRFKRSLCKWDNKYLYDEQQDSQQFLIQLLDWLKEDLNLNLDRPIYTQSQDNVFQNLEKKAGQAWKNHLARNNSIIEFLMAGMLKSGIQCVQCLYQSYNFQTFLTLPLPVTKSQKQTSQSFYIKICFVPQNLSRKAQIKTILLENYWYQDALLRVKHQFDLSQDSFLIGLFYPNNTNIQRIQTFSKGSQCIKKARLNPDRLSLVFLQYSKTQLLSPNVQITFDVKYKQNNKSTPNGFSRYLFFRKKQGSIARQVFKKLLKYFYKVVFKHSEEVTQEQYMQKYLSENGLPFRVYLQKSNQQLNVNDEISLNNKSKIIVLFQTDQIFNYKMLNKCVSLGAANTSQKIGKVMYQQSLKPMTMNIYDCFMQFQKTEIIDFQNSWHCPKCNEKRKAYKKISVYKCPKILILFFKRFASQYGQDCHQTKKVNTFVQFPNILDLDKYVEKREMPYTGEKIQAKYRLFAVANHHTLGNYNEQIGHYTAFVNHINNWYRINDEKIYPVGQGDVCTKDGYILFYSRLESP